MADINPVWGTWHYKEEYPHKGPCFETVFHINSYGARDMERKRISKDSNRVIVLGDSFIEGFAVDEKDRVTNLLENKTGREFLNFGCSFFGPGQEYIIYKNLADSFNHSTVLLGLFPFNDFFDDDIDYAKKMEPVIFKRYRPYFIGNFPNYQLSYYYPVFKETTFNKEAYIKKENSVPSIIRRFLNAYTCWFNVLQYIRFYSSVSSSEYKKNYSGFNDYSSAQMQRMLWLIGMIRQVAAGKRFIIFTIPVKNEITTYKKNHENKLAKILEDFCKKQNIEYIDLLPVFARQQDITQFYLPCDPHWNEEGNKLVADTLLKLFK